MEQAGYDFLLTLTMGGLGYVGARLWIESRQTAWRRRLHQSTRRRLS